MPSMVHLLQLEGNRPRVKPTSFLWNKRPFSTLLDLLMPLPLTPRQFSYAQTIQLRHALCLEHLLIPIFPPESTDSTLKIQFPFHLFFCVFPTLTGWLVSSSVAQLQSASSSIITKFIAVSCIDSEGESTLREAMLFPIILLGSIPSTKVNTLEVLNKCH